MIELSNAASPKKISMKPLIRVLLGLLLSSASAVLLVLSMPPYGIWPLAIIGFLPLVLAQYRILPNKMSGLAMAVTIGGLIALYIMDAFMELPNAPWFMKWLPLIFGAIILFTDAGTRSFHERTGYRWLVLSSALGWVGVEMIRSLIPIMGTWGFLAYAYFRQPWLIQPVSIFGVFGLSLVTTLLGYALGEYALVLFDKRWQLDAGLPALDTRDARKWLIGTGAVFATWTILSLTLLWVNPTEQQIRVAAIQPNYRELWTPEEDATNTLSYERFLQIGALNYQRMVDQTKEAAANGAQLIVWPEGGLVFDPAVTHTQELENLAEETQTYLVMAYGVDYRNEVTVLAPSGEFLGVYGKNHPVSFVGERSQTGGSYTTYPTNLANLGTIICYDLDFTDTARKTARNGANLIAVPSGDWPGIADKHYVHLVFRAVENRTAMIKADRSYDSAIIDPYGHIIDAVVSTAGSQTTLVADVVTVESNPLQIILGDWIGWISLGGMALFSLANIVTSYKTKHKTLMPDFVDTIQMI